MSAQRYLADNRPIDAEVSLEQALDIKPGFADGRFEMGRTVLAQREVTHALEWFSRLAGDERSPRSAAYAGYCNNLLGDAQGAVAWYEKAMEWGCTSPEVYNNYAVSLTISRNRYSMAERLSLAEKYLSLALKQAPKHDSVRFNWVHFAVEQARDSDVHLTADTLAMGRDLATAYPTCGHVQALAASAFGLASNYSSQVQDEALNYLEKAAALGHLPDASAMAYGKDWASLRTKSRFASVSRSSPEIRHAPRKPQIERIVEPRAVARLTISKSPM
jgi:tetratricopeptide (TPR) repeat protein